jgi:hypothetical protein
MLVDGREATLSGQTHDPLSVGGEERRREHEKSIRPLLDCEKERAVQIVKLAHPPRGRQLDAQLSRRRLDGLPVLTQADLLGQQPQA